MWGVLILFVFAVTFLVSPFVSSSDSALERKRIVVLETMHAPIVAQFTEGFLNKLQKLNNPEQYQLEITRLNAEGNAEKADKLLIAALDENVSLVVSVATLAARVAKNHLQDSNIPHVFMCVTDPIGAGLVEKIGLPSGRNITGKVHYMPVKARIETVVRLVGGKHTGRKVRFGYIHTDYPADMSDLARIQAEEKKRNDIEFIPYLIPYQQLPRYSAELLEQLEEGIGTLDQRVDYYWAPRGALAVLPEHDEIILNKAAKPFVVGATEGSVKKGALLHMTGDPISQGEDAAVITMQILQGKEVAEIPVTLPGRIQFALNTETATQLQLVIPSDILQLAGDNLYP